MCHVARSNDILLQPVFFCRIVFRKRQSVRLTKVCKYVVSWILVSESIILLTQKELNISHQLFPLLREQMQLVLAWIHCTSFWLGRKLSADSTRVASTVMVPRLQASYSVLLLRVVLLNQHSDNFLKLLPRVCTVILPASCSSTWYTNRRRKGWKKSSWMQSS